MIVKFTSVGSVCLTVKIEKPCAQELSRVYSIRTFKNFCKLF